MGEHTTLFSGISPTRAHYLSANTGVRSTLYSFVSTYRSAAVVLNLAKPNHEENVRLFE